MAGTKPGISNTTILAVAKRVILENDLDPAWQSFHKLLSIMARARGRNKGLDARAASEIRRRLYHSPDVNSSMFINDGLKVLGFTKRDDLFKRLPQKPLRPVAMPRKAKR